MEFDIVLEPKNQVLATVSELRAIEGSARLWRTQSSGIVLPDEIATAPRASSSVDRRPAPTKVTGRIPIGRDEQILALDVYLRYRIAIQPKNGAVIHELSRELQQLGAKLFPPSERAETFRNANGAYTKPMNFRRVDPAFKGLARGAKSIVG